MKKITIRMAHYLFAIPFAVFGIVHVTNAEKMAAYVPLPGGEFWVYLTGVAMILAAISIISGKLVRVACYGLAALMLVFIVTEQIPGLMDPARMQMAMGGLLKDTSLMGGALLLASHHHKENETAHI